MRAVVNTATNLRGFVKLGEYFDELKKCQILKENSAVGFMEPVLSEVRVL